MITFEKWQTIAQFLTADTEARIKRNELHGKENALIETVRRYNLTLVQLRPDGACVGLIDKDGSDWAMLVTITTDMGQGRQIVTHLIQAYDKRKWTGKKLQKFYLEDSED